jgi:hypothetical protein
MGLTLDSSVKLPDIKILMLKIESKVVAVEHNSSTE